MLFYFIPRISWAPLTRVRHESGHGLILCSANHFSWSVLSHSSLSFSLASSFYIQWTPFSFTYPRWSHSEYAHVRLSQEGHTGWWVPPRDKGGTRRLGGKAPTLFFSALAEFCVAWWKDDRPTDHKGQVLAPELPTMWPGASVFLICEPGDWTLG